MACQQLDREEGEQDVRNVKLVSKQIVDYVHSAKIWLNLEDLVGQNRLVLRGNVCRYVNNSSR